MNVYVKVFNSFGSDSRKRSDTPVLFFRENNSETHWSLLYTDTQRNLFKVGGVSNGFRIIIVLAIKLQRFPSTFTHTHNTFQ